MASNRGKCCRNVKWLVASKKVMDTESAWNKLEYPVLKGADGVYFINDVDDLNETLTKMSNMCKKPVARMYYVDSDNDEVPIDSEVEYKEALKVIGQRTDKGKFTTMKFDTELVKNKKKKEKMKTPKKTGDKLGAKQKDSKPLSTRPLLNLSHGNVSSDAEKGNCLQAELDKLKSDLSKVWMEKYLHRIKLEIMADVEALLEPHIREQKRISAMVAALSLEDGAAPPKHLKTHTEADHNYSAPSSSKDYERKKSGRERNESGDLNPKMYEEIPPKVNRDEKPLKEPKAQCVLHPEGGLSNACYFDDYTNGEEDAVSDTLSFSSGEISVTESESDGDEGIGDFVDVPLPSCFNVIARQDTTRSKCEKDGISSKADHEEKCAKNEKTEHYVESQGDERMKKLKSISKRNGLPSKKFETKKDSMTKENSKQESDFRIQRISFSENGGHVKTANPSQNKPQDYLNNNQLKEKDQEKHESFRDVDDLNGQDSDAFDEDYDDHYDEYVENTSDKNNLTSSSSDAYDDEAAQRAGQDGKQQNQGEQNDSLPLEGKLSFLVEGVPTPMTYTTGFSRLQSGSTMPLSKHHILQARQKLLHSFGQQQPMLVMANVPSQNMYMQNSPIQKTALHPPPLSSVKPQDLTPANLVTQHQQVVNAARRAAHQAQQTQNLILKPTQPQQQSAQSDCLSRESKTPASQSQQPNTCHNTRNQLTLCQVQETPQEVRLWNEIDAVDLELRKWVLMCQQLMERVPRYMDEASPSTQGSLKKMMTMVARINSDLGKVYIKFRKEVQIVARQIDAQKLQKQQLLASGQQHPWSEDPILILPERLMDIISATLNTTFNILGNIGKIKVLNRCTSERSEPSSPSPAVEKPQQQTPSGLDGKLQPQASATIVPISSVRAGYTAQNPYGVHPIPYNQYCLSLSNASQNPVETVTNQDLPAAFQMRSVAVSATPGPGPNYPLVWGQSAPQIQQQQQLQPQHMMYPYIQGQMQRQQAVPPQVQAGMLSQPIPQHVQHLQQLILRDEASGRQVVDNRQDTPYNTVRLHDYPLNASETHSKTAMPTFYQNTKSGTGASGLGPKTYGAMKN